MSEKFELVKYWFLSGLWNENKVHNAVGRFITEEEYEIITGNAYTS